MMLVGAGAALFYLTRPQRLARMAAGVIQQLTGAEATIDTARLTRTGEIHLDGLVLTIPGEAADADPLLEVEHVVLKPNLWALVTGRFDAHWVRLANPTLHLTEDLATGQFTFQKLRRHLDQSGRPETLPQVSVGHGMLRFAEVGPGGFKPLGSLQLDGTLTENPCQRGEYLFVLRQRGPADGPDPVLRGSLDLNGMKSRVVVEHFSLDHPQRNFLPKRLRDWWDRLEPEGSLPTIEVAYDPDPAVGLHARIAIEGGGLRLRLFDNDLDDDFAPRMTDVSGLLVVENETIRIQNLRGQVESIRYTVNGAVQGFEPIAPLSLTVTTNAFELEPDPDYLAALGPMVQKHYHRFSPTGTFKARVRLVRHTRGGPVEYDGSVDVINGTAAYHKFPYPVRQIHGRIRFTHEQLQVEELRGTGPADGELVLSGTVTPPGSGAAVNMHIVASDLALDEHVRRAMNARHRKMLDLFFDEPAHRQLVRQGLIRSADSQQHHLQKPPIEDPPLFELAGRSSVVIDIERPFGEDKRYEVTTTVQAAGLRAVYKHWPYPLAATGGQLVIGRDAVRIEKVTVRGPTGATATIDGTVDRGDHDRLRPDIKLTDVKIPIDEMLMASIEPPRDRWIRDLQLTGTLVGSGEILRRADGEIDFALNGDLSGGTAVPHGGTLKLRDLTGPLTVRRWRVELQDVIGRVHDGTLGLGGEARWDADQLEMDLRFTATDLALNSELLDLLPPTHPARPRLSGLFDRYRPTGRFNGQLEYRTIGGGDVAGDFAAETIDKSREESGSRGGDETYRIKLEPATFAFDLRGRRIEFDRISGQIVVRPDGVEMNDLAASFEHGSTHLSGHITFGQEPVVTLRLGAAADRFDDTARAFLPTAVTRAIDGLKLNGGYRIDARQLIRRWGTGTGPALQFSASVQLINASAEVGVPIRGLNGRLNIDATRPSDQPWTRIDLRLHGNQLRAADRLIKPLDMHLVRETQRDLLQVKKFLGSIYEGALVGSGFIQLGGPGIYHFDLTLEDVELEPFLSPLAARQPGGNTADGRSEPPDRATESGLLSASLSIEDHYHKAVPRRGRGTIKVHDATLYDRPLAFAVLQAANLALPADHAFDRASARYLIDGDTVLFDSIRFESPNLVIAGAGTMDYPTRKLNLNMVSRNPGAADLGALSEMVNVFTDELMAIQVTGTLDKPKARVVSLKGIRQSWHELFGKTRARRQQSRPLRGRAEAH